MPDSDNTAALPVDDARPHGHVKRDRLIKALFALVAIAIFGSLVVRQYITPSIDGWTNDFDQALVQAKQQDRQLVALVFDSPQNFDYTRVVTVIKKKGNVEAVEKGNFVCVQVRIGKDHPLIEKYGIINFPTTLLLNPDGSLVTAWSGYIGEVDFRAKFLQGDKQFDR